MDLVTQNSYERRHKQSTIPPALQKGKEMKEAPIQKNTTAEQPKLPEKYRNSKEEQQL